MSILRNLKSFIAISNLTELTPFGYYARWVFVLGLMEYFRQYKGGNPEAIAALQPVLDRSKATVQSSFMKQLAFPYSFSPEALNVENKYKEDYTLINNWFNNYIKDLAAIPLAEKDIFRQGIFMLKNARIGFPSTRKEPLARIAKQLSKKLGLIYTEFVMLKKGTEDEFGGKQQIDDLYNELESIVRKLTGTKGTRIPTDKVKELKLKNGKEVQQLIRYEDIRKELKTLTNASMYAILNDTHMEADKVAKELQKRGFRDLPFVTSKDGYTGHIGVDRRGNISLFTEWGKLLQGNVAPGSKVTMNKKYNPELDDNFYAIFKAPNAVTSTRIYTAAFKQVKHDEKHEKTESNANKVSAWVKAWERDLMNKDPMRHVPAAVALILYLTSARVGTSKENRSLKGAAQTYGISTLRKEHVRIGSASIIFDYRGKKGMQQKHTMKLDNKVNKRIAVILKWLLAGKKKGDLVFSFERPLSRTGAIQEVNPAFFRSYLKSTGVTINPHALRHIRGTELTINLLNEKDWKPSVKARTLTARQREAENYIKHEIAEKVAKLLGHKTMKNGVEQPAWATSVKSYINPAVLVSWFKDRSLSVPKWIPASLDD